MIDFKKNQQYSTVWKTALQKLKKKKLLESYKRDNSRIKLVEESEDNQFINYLRERINSIGTPNWDTGSLPLPSSSDAAFPLAT